MYTLALDTSGYKIHLVLLKNDTVVFERDWRSEMNEDETITKTLQHLSELEPFYMQKLTRIIVNEGPGTLTGTRVGVAIANALSFACKAPLVKLQTEEIWKKRLHDAANPAGEKNLKPHLLIRITEQELFVDGKITPLAELSKAIKKDKKHEYVAYGELTPTQISELNSHKRFTWIIEPDLLPFSSVVTQIKDKGDAKLASPKYAREPIITESKKEQLIPRKKAVPEKAGKSAKGMKAGKKPVKKVAAKVTKKPSKKPVKRPLKKSRR